MEVQYKYDVAFSFVAQDETLAASLADLLQDRLKVFIYSQQQKELAGNDGEIVFGRVFGEEARLVVVLYRPGWGETPWTRIEETAIRNRAYSEGYEFVTFIPLEPPAVPKWLPKTKIWLGLERWGLQSAASVIEARVQELGGDLKDVESAHERAARFARRVAFEKNREIFLGSHEGVEAADSEFALLCGELRAIANKITQSGGPVSFDVKNSVSFNIKQVPQDIILVGSKVSLSVSWQRQYANSLNGAVLKVTFWDRHPPLPGLFVPAGRIDPIKKVNLKFDIAAGERRVWRMESQAHEFSSSMLAEDLIKQLFDLMENIF